MNQKFGKFVKMNSMIFPELKVNLDRLVESFDQIPENRKRSLETLSRYVAERHASGSINQVIVICTHNSRRSHMGQLFLALAADYFEVDSFVSYSGGTEATAFHPNAVGALRRFGFQIESKDLSLTNPVYDCRWTAEMKPYQAFSTRFDESPNPKSQFAALLVCSDADEACPVVLGADFRLAHPYDDPKAFDGTDLESSKYYERAEEIGREMLYVFSLVV